MNFKQILCTVFFSMLGTQLWALNSTALKMTWGDQYLSYKISASANLDPVWYADIYFVRTEFGEADTLGWSNQYFLELNRITLDALVLSGNYSYSHENNNSAFFGPGVSIFYTYFNSEHTGYVLEKLQSQSVSDVFTLGVDCSLLVYQAEVEVVTDPSTTDEIELRQLAPMGFLDVALLPGWINIHVSGGYYFYSEDPSQIIFRVDPFLSTDAELSFESLMAGLLWASWNAGVFIDLPYTVKLMGNYGSQKLVYPEEWVDSYDLSLSGKIMKCLTLKVGWQHFSSSLSEDDYYTVAIQLSF